MTFGKCCEIGLGKMKFALISSFFILLFSRKRRFNIFLRHSLVVNATYSTRGCGIYETQIPQKNIKTPYSQEINDSLVS